MKRVPNVASGVERQKRVVGGARLETARRRVAEHEKLVAVWRETISGLKQEGQSTELAEKMLQLMERTLSAFPADLALLEN